MSDTVNSPVLINSSSNLETINNTIQVASSVSDIASRAISFTKKTWIDNADSGTPITAADMNRLEQAIVDLNTNIQSLQDSVSHVRELAMGTLDYRGRDHELSFGWDTSLHRTSLSIYIDGQLVAFIPSGFSG